MTTFHIVRHGQTEWNKERRLQGHKDSPLTELGISEAEQVRMEIANIEFNQIFSSDTLRAKRTAEIIALERNIVIQTTELLREGTYGIYEGKKVEEYQQELQEDILKWEQLTSQQKFTTNIHPTIENGNDMASRFLTFLREVAVAFNGQNILVVSHGGMIRSLLIHLGYGTIEELGPHTVKNCARIVLESDGLDFFIKETHRIEKRIV